MAEFLGIEVHAFSEPPDDAATQEATHIAATSESLDAFQKEPHRRAWLLKRLKIPGSTLFLTGVAASDDCRRVITTLLPDIVASLIQVTQSDSPYVIKEPRLAGLPQFTNLTVEAPDRVSVATFEFINKTGVIELITIGDRPCYIKVDRDGASYFVLACSDVLDIDAPAGHSQPLERFLSFAPFLAYLRLTFDTCCWHNPTPAACVIIDDPLLRRRYGFIDFSRIDARLSRSRCSVNIAFIPWNYRRTDPLVARQFLRADRCLSISIHGCDHTNNEFGVDDHGWLLFQSRRALSWMEDHQRLTGIKHNRIMVFPQGRFSRASLRALADEGFLGAVNSTLRPVDETQTEITFRNLMSVAVTWPGTVPLFLRHYAERLGALALDVFLGRQVLIVEHHQFFREGYEALERVTNFVNDVAPGIQWTDLDELCNSACLMRQGPDERMFVRAFGPMLYLRNTQHQRKTFSVSNVWGDGRLEAVMSGNQSIEFQVVGTESQCEITLRPGENKVLRFNRATNVAPLPQPRLYSRRRLKVFIRRHLSEIRDNYIDRSARLSEIVKRGIDLLPSI